MSSLGVDELTTHNFKPIYFGLTLVAVILAAILALARAKTGNLLPLGF
jgi:hypothetical protein